MLPDKFEDKERLYRAVYPHKIFWKYDEKGRLSLSSAALRDKNGLSVDRGYFRGDQEVIESMQKRLEGRIISFEVLDCQEVGASVKYKPSLSNEYHSEVHGGENQITLSAMQRKKLSRVARILT